MVAGDVLCQGLEARSVSVAGTHAPAESDRADVPAQWRWDHGRSFNMGVLGATVSGAPSSRQPGHARDF